MKKTTQIRMPPPMPPRIKGSFCCLLYVVLKREYTPDPRGLMPGFDRAIDEQRFFFVVIDREHPADALTELTYPTSYVGRRLITVTEEFRRRNHVIWSEPVLLDGLSIAFAREAEHWEISLPDDSCAETFWKPMGPYVEAYLKHLRQVSLLVAERANT